MSNFQPKEVQVFQFAQFVIFVDSLPLLSARLGLLVLTILAGILVATNFLGLLLLFFAFEIFFQVKIKKFAPSKKVTQIGKDDNLAEVCSIDAAAWILKSKTPEQLFLNFTQKDFGRQFIARAGIEKAKLENLNWEGFTDLTKLVEKALDFAKKTKRDLITPLNLLVSCFVVIPDLAKLAFDADLSEDDLVAVSLWVDVIQKERQRPFFIFDKSQIGAGIAQDWVSGYTLETEKYAFDVTAKMTRGELRPYLVGREEELAQIQEILAKDAKKNVILTGDAGVGKTTIVLALAAKCFEGSVLAPLRYRRVLELNLSALLAGGTRGELEKRIADIISEIEKAADVILFIPNIETIAGAANVDVSQLLIPVLGGAKVQVVGTTTAANYTKFIEPRAEFAQDFDKLAISEPDLYSSVAICQKAATKIEKSKQVVISYKAVLSAVKLSDRYMQDRVLPGKAIDLLDQAAVKVAAADRGEVLEADIVELISEKTKIPLEAAAGAESEKLLNLEKILHYRVVNQNQAIEAIAESLRRARAKVRQDTRPIGAFLFLGPTGVGKTETARALAESYFGGENKMIRLDMSEFQTQDAVGRLIGQGGERGQLTQAVRATPFSLILLDEVEKANQAVLQLFLQVFDEGRLTDVQGLTVDFTQAIIIATSNAGAEDIRQQILAGKNLADFKGEFINNLLEKGIFNIEFLNRFTEIILFRPLTNKELLAVARLIMQRLSKNLAQQEIEVNPTDQFLSYVVEKGTDPVFGARSLQRLVEDKVEGLIAKKILVGEVKRGDKMIVDFENREVVLKKS